MEDVNVSLPKLEQLVHLPVEIDSDLPVRDVVDIFQKDESLLALPVFREGKFVGLVNRKTFFSRDLGRPFAMDLYGKKPIEVLVNWKGLTMSPSLDVSAALAELLEADPTLGIDSFAVVDGETYVGIVSVSDLMMKVSGTQALLLENLQTLSQRIRDEVAKAGRIQNDLLPKPEFTYKGIAIAAESRNSTEVGGDFYDYFVVDESTLGMMIADVSGHGVHAGMMTTAAKASLHTLVSMGINKPSLLLAGMNKAILATAKQALLMTCLVAFIDLKNRRLTVSNAGHNFPYLCRQSGEIEQLQEIYGFPLGLDADPSFGEISTRFDLGDTLVMYTDGIVECLDEEEQEFGYQQLEEVLRNNPGAQPVKVKEALLAAVYAFNGNKGLDDDVTTVIAKFQGEPDGENCAGHIC